MTAKKLTSGIKKKMAPSNAKNKSADKVDNDQKKGRIGRRTRKDTTLEKLSDKDKGDGAGEKRNGKKKDTKDAPPGLSPVGASDDEDEESVSVYDSADDDLQLEDGEEDQRDVSEEDDDDEEEEEYDSNAEVNSNDDDASSLEEEDEGEDFEDQGSSDEDEDLLEEQARAEEDSSDDECAVLEKIDEAYDAAPRAWRTTSKKRSAGGKAVTITENAETNEVSSFNDNKVEEETINDPKVAQWMHTDDLSSDDDDPDGTSNRIGRVPLHWYDEYDHIGYDVHGTKIGKSQTGDALDRALQNASDVASKKFVVHDALNGVDVELTPRQIELIRRIQAGAHAHPEHDANPDYIDYYSAEKEISGINSDRHEPKHRFQPSKWEKLQVRRLLHRLQTGKINMDYLTGKVRDMNDVHKKPQDGTDKPFLLWKGDEEDELAYRKGPQHIAAPKVPPPGHAESYIPPDEYLPTEEELKEWEEMDAKDRPHGLLIPKKFPNLRSVGAYEHSVRESFERCLDLYLCPRILKRRLNIDPESLVPRLPKANDLRPFPTALCVRYETPHEDDEEAPIVRCLGASPDGQFLVSGANDGVVRMWEVQTGRLLRSWDLNQMVNKLEGDSEERKDSPESKGDGEKEEKTSFTPAKKPVVALEWNPNRSHHALLAACGKCAFVIATGTGGPDDAELTEALLSAASTEGIAVKNDRAAKAVKWVPLNSSIQSNNTPISAYGLTYGPVCALWTNHAVTSLRWHKKGDYFLTVSPKSGAAAVLIHQLSKAQSQQPFRKAKGEAQTACFHPNKPFLFVASQQHVRVYHLVKQSMVKRLISGCRWISSIDIHPSGDHVVVGSLDRRMVWFDLDLSSTPYKTLKYHERALRSVGFHPRYPLMASSSDDGTVHVFHSMVYSDLMRNPLIVPVKVLRGHKVVNKMGVLSMVFHPTQPWLFSAGADGQIQLYQDI